MHGLPLTNSCSACVTRWGSGAGLRGLGMGSRTSSTPAVAEVPAAAAACDPLPGKGVCPAWAAQDGRKRGGRGVAQPCPALCCQPLLQPCPSWNLAGHQGTALLDRVVAASTLLFGTAGWAGNRPEQLACSGPLPAPADIWVSPFGCCPPTPFDCRAPAQHGGLHQFVTPAGKHCTCKSEQAHPKVNGPSLGATAKTQAEGRCTDRVDAHLSGSCCEG